MDRLYSFLAAVLILGSMFIPGARALAQDRQRCFDVPGITQCITGRFLEYWEQNGGLPVFGYPITPATMERTADGTFLTQYFERNRFELHPENARPYDVLLGRLGDDRLGQQRRDWRAFGPSKPVEGCRFFQETGHNICDITTGIGFKTYWESHGLQDPALDVSQRSLALFGLPLSDVLVETNVAGDTVLTQWFERARFEYHLDKPREFAVLLGLLGNEIRTAPAQPVTSLPAPPAVPTECNGLGASEQAIAAPNCVKAGALIGVGVFGFEPNEAIVFRVTTAAGAAVGGDQTTRVGVNGFTLVDIDTKNYAGVALSPGDYIFVAEDTRGQNRRARAPFRVLP
jgi:hypothetical protein